MRKICLLLALCLTLTIITGCGGKTPPSTDPGTQSPPETDNVPSTTVPTTTVPPATAAPTDPPEVIAYELEVPEGFYASVVQDGYHVYLSPNAPRDLSSIQVEVLPMDESVLNRTKDEFEDMLRLTLATPAETTAPTETGDPSETTAPTEPQPEKPTDFHIYRIATTEVEGWPALFCDYNLTYGDYIAHVYRYEVVVNYNNYVFTFTDITDSNVWLDSFEDCAHAMGFMLDTDGIELDYSHLTRYKLKCGMEIYAEDGMELHDAPGFTACLGNRNVIILLMEDDKESNNLTTMDLNDYAKLLGQTNELEDFKTDIYGNLYTDFYSTDENGIEYYNMLCVKESQDSFWVCQIACMAEDQASYAREFSLWASSLVAD